MKIASESDIYTNDKLTWETLNISAIKKEEEKKEKQLEEDAKKSSAPTTDDV